MNRNGKKILKKLLCPCLLVTGLFLCAGCSRTVKYTLVNTAMGTFVYQTVYTSGEDVTGEITALLHSLEQDTLSFRLAESEVARINTQAGAAEGIVLSEKCSQELAVLLQVSERSGGAFDITIHPVVQLWNIDAWAAGSVQENRLSQYFGEGQNQRPEQAATESVAEHEGEITETSTFSPPATGQIEAALAQTGYEALRLENGRLFLPEGMSLDLGAAGKGIACDEIAGFLQERQVSGAVISVGGSVLTYGSRPDGAPWQVAVVDPADTGKYLGTLSLSGVWFVSTSGDYERYAEADGIRYHHILDPATGYPAANGVRSVTIVCDSGILSDALSTACFVLGVEEGMALAESYGAKALFVDTAGEIFMTEDMREIFRKTGEK